MNCRGLRPLPFVIAPRQPQFVDSQPFSFSRRQMPPDTFLVHPNLRPSERLIGIQTDSLESLEHGVRISHISDEGHNIGPQIREHDNRHLSPCAPEYATAQRSSQIGRAVNATKLYEKYERSIDA